MKVALHIIVSLLILASCTHPSNKVTAKLIDNNTLIASVFKQTPQEYHVWTKTEISSNKEAQDLKIKLALHNESTIYFYNDSTLDEGHYYASYLSILVSNPLQAFNMRKGKSYIESGDTITLISTQGATYDLNTSRKLNENDVDLLKRALKYIKAHDAETVFLYLTDNDTEEDFYASYNGVTIHHKATVNEITTNMISELNEGMKIESVENITVFFSKIDRAKKILADCSDESLKRKLSSTLSKFQKLYYPKARKVYYQNAKKKLWEKNIEVSLSGKDITFIGYMFIDNKVKKDTYTEVCNELIKLKFKTVGFKAFDDDAKTYWNLETNNDSYI